jgi:hypothetical protein
LVREINDVDVTVNLLLVTIVAFNRVLNQILQRVFLDVAVGVDELVVENLVDVLPMLLVSSP